jgi:DNA-binding transcriptional ArsR family regulator
MADIDDFQAEFLKTLASPRRLRIMHRLGEGPVSVARLATELGISQPNASQHLAVMRAAGVVDADRDGREVRYRIADPEIVVACGIVRAVLERRFERLANLTSAPPPTTAATTTADEHPSIHAR